MRSLREHQHPNFCKSVAEYYADLDAAIAAIGAPVLLAGHSTGGLISSLYAKEGARRSEVRALWLNSAFFDWRAPAARLPWLHVAAATGRFFPFLTVPERLPPTYNNLLLEQWEFDTRLKPVQGFPLYYGWIGAISDAHARARVTLVGARNCSIRAGGLIQHSPFDVGSGVATMFGAARPFRNKCRLSLAVEEYLPRRDRGAGVNGASPALDRGV